MTFWRQKYIVTELDIQTSRAFPFDSQTTTSRRIKRLYSSHFSEAPVDHLGVGHHARRKACNQANRIDSEELECIQDRLLQDILADTPTLIPYVVNGKIQTVPKVCQMKIPEDALTKEIPAFELLIQPASMVSICKTSQFSQRFYVETWQARMQLDRLQALFSSVANTFRSTEFR
jgi:hypothetical protein